MYQLMISLDKKILDPNSAVARRMIEYGKTDELFIIIPSKEKKSFDLSGTVHVQSTGGWGKVAQFIKLFQAGNSTIQQFNNSTPAVEAKGLTAGRAIEQFTITTQDPLFTGLVGWCLKKKFNLKFEVQMHGDFLGDYYKKQWFKLSLAKFVLKRVDAVRVVGERIKQSLLNLNIPENKIFVRSVPIDAELIENHQAKMNLHEKYHGYEKIFLVLGRLDPVKNIPWLIEIFKEVIKQKSKYLLLIIGSGTEERSLMSYVQCSMLHKNIAFESWTNDPCDYLKTTDCLLFPSLSEGYGLVAMEARAAGCSVIMNDVGVANYELKPSARVRIIPVSDRDAWIKAILVV